MPKTSNLYPKKLTTNQYKKNKNYQMNLIDEREKFKCYKMLERKIKNSIDALMQRRVASMIGRGRGEMCFLELLRKWRKMEGSYTEYERKVSRDASPNHPLTFE